MNKLQRGFQLKEELFPLPGFSGLLPRIGVSDFGRRGFVKLENHYLLARYRLNLFKGKLRFTRRLKPAIQLLKLFGG